MLWRIEVAIILLNLVLADELRYFLIRYSERGIRNVGLVLKFAGIKKRGRLYFIKIFVNRIAYLYTGSPYFNHQTLNKTKTWDNYNDKTNFVTNLV